MDIIIRKAKKDDLEDMLRLNKALFDYEIIFNDEYNLDWTYSEVGRNYFKKIIEDDMHIGLVAEVANKNKVIGYIAISLYHRAFRNTNPIAELDNMFIEESYRRNGAGKMLVQEAKRLAKEKGATRLKVESAAQNEKAINFYRSCGFTDFDVILEMNL